MAVDILIYEDNAALRHSLEELFSFSEEFIVIAALDNCLQSESDVKNYNPDVILMDIDLPGLTGIEAIKKIRQFNKKTAILVLTVFDDNKHVFDAICAGASGYLLKKHAAVKLVAAIKEVLEGGAPMSPSVAKMVVNSMHIGQGRENDYNFTQREKEILSLLCKGNSYKMIATQTNLTFETVRSYIKNIYEKLQVHSATEAVSKAMNERLI